MIVGILKRKARTIEVLPLTSIEELSEFLLRYGGYIYVQRVMGRGLSICCLKSSETCILEVALSLQEYGHDIQIDPRINLDDMHVDVAHVAKRQGQNPWKSYCSDKSAVQFPV